MIENDQILYKQYHNSIATAVAILKDTLTYIYFIIFDTDEVQISLKYSLWFDTVDLSNGPTLLTPFIDNSTVVKP